MLQNMLRNAVRPRRVLLTLLLFREKERGSEMEMMTMMIIRSCIENSRGRTWMTIAENNQSQIGVVRNFWGTCGMRVMEGKWKEMRRDKRIIDTLLATISLLDG